MILKMDKQPFSCKIASDTFFGHNGVLHKVTAKWLYFLSHLQALLDYLEQMEKGV